VLELPKYFKIALAIHRFIDKQQSLSAVAQNSGPLFSRRVTLPHSCQTAVCDLPEGEVFQILGLSEGTSMLP
jgi:hypothetical protein